MPIFLTVLLTLISFGSIVPDLDQDVDQNHRIVLSLTQNDFLPGNQQLAISDELNITLFEVSNLSQLRSFPVQTYDFLLAIGPEYMVPGVLSKNLPSVAENIIQKYRESENGAPGNIAALGILIYPFENYPGYHRSTSALAETLAAEIPVPFYLQSLGFDGTSRPEGINFISERVTAGQTVGINNPVVHFVPSSDQKRNFTDLNRTMDQLLGFDESILILPAEWFYDQIEAQSELRYLFRDHINGKQVVLPLPAPTNPEPSVNWSIVLLFILWGSFAVHYRFQPIYSQSVIRYFSNHTFFVDDVMENRMRNVSPGFLLLAQHALLTGLFVFASVEVLVSGQGLCVLSHYFPGIMPFKGVLLSLFTAGVLIAVLYQSIAVLWIYISNKHLSAFSQILNLYSWPLHLNLLTVTFLIVFNQIGISELMIMVLGALFILIWFFSFNIAAVDSSKLFETGLSKVTFLILTAGLHLLLIIGALVYILYTPSILEPILFALEIA